MTSKKYQKETILIKYSGDYMRIIAQQTDALNTYDFWNNVTEKDYIDAMALNVALTKDNQILTYNIVANNEATTNTIKSSTLAELKNYELELFEDTLKSLSERNLNKDIYVNIAPFRTSPLTEQNIQETTERMNIYIDKIKETIDKYPNLTIHLHTINRSLIMLLQQKIKNHRIGFVITNRDLNFVDVDYYVMTMNAFNDTIINLLLSQKKEVILYLHSDYYISFVYNHYMGPNSTPNLKQTFNELGILTNYPEIINKVFT